MRPKLSIIIPTKNEEQNIKRCLGSIKHQKENTEIIVVDNFSQDRTAEIAKKYTKYVFTKGDERSKQRNWGLSKTSGEFVLFIDADMELQPGVISQIVEKFTKNQDVVAIVIDEMSYGKNYLAKIKLLEKELTTGINLIEAARAFRKKSLVQIGGWDEQLIAGEDWDLTQRIKNLGKIDRISAKIIHHENQSIVADLKKKYYYAQNIQEYQKKYPDLFSRQAGFERISAYLKRPNIIFASPVTFIGLLILKSAQYLAYLIAKVKSSL